MLQVLVVVGVLLLPTALFGAGIGVGRLLSALVERRDLRHRARQAAEQQPLARVPIQVLAAELRRLAAEVESQRTTLSGHPSAVRRRATALAYDDRLVEACNLLGVEQCLAVRHGRSRDVERLRVEAALAAAGLDVRPRSATVQRQPPKR